MLMNLLQLLGEAKMYNATLLFFLFFSPTADAFVISFVCKEAGGKHSKLRAWCARAQPEECILISNPISCHHRQSKAVSITVPKFHTVK